MRVSVIRANPSFRQMRKMPRANEDAAWESCHCARKIQVVLATTPSTSSPPIPEHWTFPYLWMHYRASYDRFMEVAYVAHGWISTPRVTHALRIVRTFGGGKRPLRRLLAERDCRRARNSNPGLQFTVTLASAP